MKLSELKAKITTPPKILLLGDYGSGKTVLAATVGKYGRFIDLNQGLLSAITVKDEFTQRRLEIDVRQCYESDPNKALAYGIASSYIQSCYDEVINKKTDTKVLIIDGLTDLAEYCMRKVMDGVGKLHDQPQIQHWGPRDNYLTNLMVLLKAMPIAVILIAHVKRVEVDGVSRYELAMGGQALPPKFPPMFDEVWFLDVIGSTVAPKRVIRTHKDAIYPGRTRAQIPNLTDVSCGMPKLLELCGYKLE